MLLTESIITLVLIYGRYIARRHKFIYVFIVCGKQILRFFFSLHISYRRMGGRIVLLLQQ